MAMPVDYFNQPEHAIQRAIERSGRHQVIAVGTAFSKSDIPSLSKATQIKDLCHLIASSERIAAVVIAPKGEDVVHKRFLNRVKELTSAEGALLIWNGSRELLDFYEIKADLICDTEGLSHDHTNQ